MDSKTFLKFNVNHHVWVKLTDRGVAELLKYKNRYAEHVGAVTLADINKWNAVTEDGYYCFQMHQFMEVFGDVVSSSSMFETNVYFDPSEMKNPEKKCSEILQLMHDATGPCNSIKAGATLLRDGTLTAAETAKVLDAIGKMADELNAVLDAYYRQQSDTK